MSLLIRLLAPFAARLAQAVLLAGLSRAGKALADFAAKRPPRGGTSAPSAVRPDQPDGGP